MEQSRALAALEALGQPTRLAAFRLLVGAGAEGLPAGGIAAALGVRQNTLSTHLSILLAAGLIRADRRGRSICYAADRDGLRALLGWLLQDCCGGRPELCGPVINQIACTC